MKWHRLFGLALTDFFTGTAYRVELEVDLSLKQQFLDVVIIEQESGAMPEEVPDGLDNLAKHNLLTYKSLRQALDSWALDELVGHYVNYRKQISPSLKKLLPGDDFRLYAVCTRFPDKLVNEYSLKPIRDGVFEVQWGSHEIRIIILSRILEEKRNALWELFSGLPEKFSYGAGKYQWRQLDVSTVINDLYQQYKEEGIAMPYTIEDYRKEKEKEKEKDRLKWLKNLPPEARLRGLPLEERLKGLSKKDLLRLLSIEDRLEGLSVKEIEAYLKKLHRHKN